VSILKGIFGAMCTPFQENGEGIDLKRYHSHIDNLLEAGVHGLVLCSGTGEYAYLTDEERHTLIIEGIKHINGRCPTIAQTTALSTKECIDKAKTAEGLGATAVMVMPPFLEPPSEKGVIHHYETIAKSIEIPIVMYNVPQQAAPLSEDAYRELLNIKNLDYVKDSSGDFLNLQRFIKTGGKVFCGIDSFAPFALMSGCTGMIWGAVNFMPHECVQLFNLIDENKYQEAMDLWKLMEPVCLWLGQNKYDVDYLTGVKAATNLSGRKMGPPRKPLLDVSDAAQLELKIALSQLPINKVDTKKEN
tara:strand:- start:42 stop:950 length:909 start_codon:yes stop_codon:yes gene_type:complete